MEAHKLPYIWCWQLVAGHINHKIYSVTPFPFWDSMSMFKRQGRRQHLRRGRLRIWWCQRCGWLNLWCATWIRGCSSGGGRRVDTWTTPFVSLHSRLAQRSSECDLGIRVLGSFVHILLHCWYRFIYLWIYIPYTYTCNPAAFLGILPSLLGAFLTIPWIKWFSGQR